MKPAFARGRKSHPTALRRSVPLKIYPSGGHDHDFIIKGHETHWDEDRDDIRSVENPPEHSDVAPAGEVRNEPRPLLRLFTVVIVIALVLPLVSLVAMGFATRRPEFSAIGLGMIALFGSAFSIALWEIISSRTNRRQRVD
jgi:hypothetical protein